MEPCQHRAGHDTALLQTQPLAACLFGVHIIFNTYEVSLIYPDLYRRPGTRSWPVTEVPQDSEKQLIAQTPFGAQEILYSLATEHLQCWRRRCFTAWRTQSPLVAVLASDIALKIKFYSAWLSSHLFPMNWGIT